MGKMTVAGIKRLTKPGLHADGGTLYLRVGPSGARSWIQRLTINGRRVDLGLGGWPVVSLKMARDRAFANRRAVAEGRDPLVERRRAKVPTFRQASERTFEANRARWRSAKTAVNWMAQMERHAFPVLADLPVNQIDREHVLRVLTPIWTAHADIARKLRGRIRAVLAWCQAHGYIEHNVAGDVIQGALPAMPAVKAHFRALPYGDVAVALATVQASQASPSAKACFRFLVLTAARSGEARLATWDEVDVESRVWRIPASRTKTGAEHRVPLADAALAVLESVRPLRDSSSLLFPSPSRPGRPLSEVTLIKLLRDQGVDAVPHGFRSSFRDWCAETGKPREVAEAALAHVVGGVEGAYFRSDLFERRRMLMDRWAAYLTEEGAEVVRLHG